MNYLLDTHVLIWYANDEDFLPANVKEEINNGNNTCYTSIICLWEISIKAALGKLLLKQPIFEFANLLFKNNIVITPVTINHLQVYGTLPLHPKDPFDRILIAQSISDNLKIITKDKLFSAYTTNIFW